MQILELIIKNITFIFFYFNFLLLVYLFFNKILISSGVDLNKTVLKKQIFSEIFVVFLIGNSFIAIIGISIFLLNLEFYYFFTIMFTISLLGLLLTQKYLLLLIKIFSLNTIKKKIKIQRNIFTVIITITLLFYLNRIFLDWNDEDEIYQYGYISRLFAEGWIIEEKFFDRGFNTFIRIGEIYSSLFYFINKNFFLIRLIKFIFFLLLLIQFYNFINFLTRSKKISELSTLLLCLIPELSYVGFFSMKTDFVLFVYETAAIIFFLYFSIILLRKKENYSKNNFLLLYLSLYLASISLALRLSGIYLFFIISLLSILLFIKNRRIFYENRKIISITILLICFAVFPQVIKQILEFNNPFHPIGGWWTDLIENSKFNTNWYLSNAKENYNIQIQFPIVNQIYVLIYISLGLSKEYLLHLHDYLIHPIDKAGSGWISPVTLITFLAPFYFKKSNEIILTSLIFLFLFIAWATGIQIVRVFLGTSVLGIIIFAQIISIEKNMISELYKKLSILTILLLFCYHALTSIRSNPYGPFVLRSDVKFNNNLIKTLHRNEWDQFFNLQNLYNKSYKYNILTKKTEIEKNFFKEDEIKLINNVLNNSKTLIFHNFEKFPHLQTLIKNGYILRDVRKYKFLIDKKRDYNICYFGFYKLQNFLKYKKFIENENNVIFVCKKNN